MSEENKSRWMTLNDELNMRKVKNFKASAEREAAKKKDKSKKPAEKEGQPQNQTQSESFLETSRE